MISTDDQRRAVHLPVSPSARHSLGHLPTHPRPDIYLPTTAHPSIIHHLPIPHSPNLTLHIHSPQSHLSLHCLSTRDPSTHLPIHIYIYSLIITIHLSRIYPPSIQQVPNKYHRQLSHPASSSSVHCLSAGGSIPATCPLASPWANLLACFLKSAPGFVALALGWAVGVSQGKS
jgi:hypothetical protein